MRMLFSEITGRGLGSQFNLRLIRLRTDEENSDVMIDTERRMKEERMERKRNDVWCHLFFFTCFSFLRMKRANSESEEPASVSSDGDVVSDPKSYRDRSVMMKIVDLDLEMDGPYASRESNTVASARYLISTDFPLSSLFYHAKYTLKWEYTRADFKSLLFMTYFVIVRLDYKKYGLLGFKPTLSKMPCGDTKLYVKYERSSLHRMVMEMHNILERIHNTEFDMNPEKYPGEKKENVLGCLNSLLVLCIAAQLVRC